ncbi:MAG: hypothetical protein AAF958_17615 [Planctomycetota bacterium]
MSLLVFAFAIACSLGCNQPPKLTWIPNQRQPVPSTNIPESMRIRNWTGRGQFGVGGSCVHASTQNVFRTVGREDLYQLWKSKKRRGYAGPETLTGITTKYRNENIPHLYTETADVSLLEKATRTNRPGIIFYYPSHCVTFIQFARMKDGREVAVLLDNNFPDRYIVIDRRTFERSWRAYDGIAAIPWVDPATPRTFPRTSPKT